jgi:hypothetical protein
VVESVTAVSPEPRAVEAVDEGVERAPKVIRPKEEPVAKLGPLTEVGSSANVEPAAKVEPAANVESAGEVKPTKAAMLVTYPFETNRFGQRVEVFQLDVDALRVFGPYSAYVHGGATDCENVDDLIDWVVGEVDNGARVIFLDDHGGIGDLRVMARVKGEDGPWRTFVVTASDLAKIMRAIAEVTKDPVLLVVLCCHSGCAGAEVMKEMAKEAVPDSVLLVTNKIDTEMAWALMMAQGSKGGFRYQATVGLHLFAELAHVSAVSPRLRTDIALAQASSRGGLGAELIGWGNPAALARPIGQVFRAQGTARFPALRPTEWFVCPSQMVPCAFAEEPFHVAADSGHVERRLKRVDFRRDGGKALDVFRLQRQYEGGSHVEGRTGGPALAHREKSTGMVTTRVARALESNDPAFLYSREPLRPEIFPLARELIALLERHGFSSHSPGVDPLLRLLERHGEVVLEVLGRELEK